MKKRILITAGPVYGQIDDNKIVSNRSRGLWAIEFGIHLRLAGHDVSMLVPDITEKQFRDRLGKLHNEQDGGIKLIVHKGYDQYRTICNDMAGKVDAMVMAAAVLNYLPESPFPGKMPTDKKVVDIRFVLTAKVINEMKARNPQMTLIGCKLLFSNDLDTLTDAAYHVLLAARCNAVIANDGKLGLRNKFVVHQDRSVTPFHNDFDGLYKHVEAIINDVHYHTDSSTTRRGTIMHKAAQLFDDIVDIYRDQWTQRLRGQDFVFGSLAVRNGSNGYLISPREKGAAFTCKDAICVQKIEDRIVRTFEGKATLNAPLLVRHLEKFPQVAAVIHLHNIPAPMTPDEAQIVAYAPPGTVRDNEREIPGLHYYIHGHGWILALDDKGEVIEWG